MNENEAQERLQRLEAGWSEGGRKGGLARAEKLSKRRRREIARSGGLAAAAKKISKKHA